MQTSAQQEAENLSAIFTALANPTRRAVIDRLGRGPASVSELAGPFDMGLPAFMKHLQVLEDSGIVSTRKEGRTRTCTIDGSGLLDAGRWLAAQRVIWEGRADRLEAFVLREEAKEASGDGSREDRAGS